jgi:hypothetical protein
VFTKASHQNNLIKSTSSHLTSPIFLDISLPFPIRFLAHDRTAMRFRFLPFTKCILSIYLENVNKVYYLGFEVLTAVVTKSSIFRILLPCSPLKISRNFGGKCHLHLQGISQAINQHGAGSKQSYSHVPPKLWSIFRVLHGVMCQKTETFKYNIVTYAGFA